MRKLTEEEFNSALVDVGLDIVSPENGEEEVVLMKEKDTLELNPAIAYKIVMDLIVDKKDEKSMETWDYLYQLSREECTHKEIDGSSSWIRPFEEIGIGYKICNYCSWN